MKKLENIEYTSRGFPLIRIKDGHGSEIRVQQSSACLSDVWLFIDKPAFKETNNAILLTEENFKDIKRFKKFLKTKGYL